MTDIEIESTDVLKLIHQYLKENQLKDTLSSFEKETGISLNTVDNLTSFQTSILSGEWDTVLKTCSHLNLPKNILMDLYEQIVIELVELREIDVARSFLRGTTPLQNLKEKFQDRYIFLETLVSKTYFEPKEAYKKNSDKQKRREYLSKVLSEQVEVAPTSRLLTLLNQSLKYQHSQGLLSLESKYDMFLDKCYTPQTEPDSIATRIAGQIKLAKKENAEVIKFSPNGQLLVTGSNYGFLQIWNPISFKLRKDLKYQNEGNFMVMEDSILSLAFSTTNSELLAAGDKSGTIQLFKVSNGHVLRTFKNAHPQGITSLILTGKDTILSASFDGLIRMFGIKSGSKLKEFRGHHSFVNQIEYSDKDEKLFSVSSDGTFKIWNLKTGECMFTLTSQDLKLGLIATNSSNLGSCTLHSLLPIPFTSNFCIASNSTTLHLLNSSGKVYKTLQLDGTNPISQVKGRVDMSTKKQFVAIATSPKGEYIYALLDDGNLYMFNLETGAVEFKLHISDKDPIGLAHHPTMNLLLVYVNDHLINCYKP